MKLLRPSAPSPPSLPARHTPNSPQPVLVGAPTSRTLPPQLPPPPPPVLLPVASKHSSRGSRRAARDRRRRARDDNDDEGSGKSEPAADVEPASPPIAIKVSSSLLPALSGQGHAIAGTQMLELERGKVSKSCSSRTSHRRTAFDDGKDAQTRKGLLGTGASEVHMAAKGK